MRPKELARDRAGSINLFTLLLGLSGLGLVVNLIAFVFRETLLMKQGWMSSFSTIEKSDKHLKGSALLFGFLAMFVVLLADQYGWSAGYNDNPAFALLGFCLLYSWVLALMSLAFFYRTNRRYLTP